MVMLSPLISRPATVTALLIVSLLVRRTMSVGGRHLGEAVSVNGRLGRAGNALDADSRGVQSDRWVPLPPMTLA